MRIPLADIQAASQCFRYHHFLKSGHPKPRNKMITIAEEVIQKSYIKASNTGFKADWRQIVGWVDSKVFKHIDVDNEQEFSDAKRESESILLFLQKWYKVHYLKSSGLGYVNVPMEVPVIHTDVVYTTAPLITLENIPYILHVDDKDRIETNLRRDFYIQGLAWMMSHILEVDKIGILYLHFKLARGGSGIVEFTVDRKQLDRTQEAIRQIIPAISAGFNFPSFTEQCNSCPFNRRCRI